MNFKYIFVFLFIWIFTNLDAQITIDAKRSVSGEQIKIDINEGLSYYSISLRIRDSVTNNKKYEYEMENLRKEFFNLKNNSLNSDSAKSITNKMEKLTELNTLYSNFETKILKKKYKEFDELINLFKSKSKEYFEKNEENKNRIVLDGTFVRIYVNNNLKTKTIWSRSPDKKSHPEINTLLTSVLEILRDNGSLKNNQKIMGY